MNFFNHFDYEVKEHLNLMETTKYHELSTYELTDALDFMNKNFSYYNNDMDSIKKVSEIFGDAISNSKKQPNNHIDEEYKTYENLLALTKSDEKKIYYERILHHLGFVMRHIDFTSNGSLHYITSVLDDMITECLDNMKVINGNINYYSNLLDKKIKYHELHKIIERYYKTFR
tara:strand:- start:74 stop:592 length:519 start_codon:yes stop_codon:yes gene_type:complete